MGSARRFPLLLLLGLAGPAAALAGYIEVGPEGSGAGGGTGWGGGARRSPPVCAVSVRLGRSLGLKGVL